MAIAYDNSSNGFNSTTTSSTVSYTTSGSNRCLVVATYSTSAFDEVYDVQYNGVALTTLTSFTTPASNYVKVWYLLNPASGANNLVLLKSSAPTTMIWCVASYTGVKQVSFPDSVNHSTGTSITSRSISTTTVNNRCWGVLSYFSANGKEPSAGTNATKRVSQLVGVGGDAVSLYDSNGYFGQEVSVTMGVADVTGSDRWGLHILTMAPTADTTGVSNFLEVF